LETREIVESLITMEPEIFEEEFGTLHHATYNCDSKKLLLEKVNIKNKKLPERWKSSIAFYGVAPSKITQFHRAIGEALKQSIDSMDK
jgi:hypothetical protein